MPAKKKTSSSTNTNNAETKKKKAEIIIEQALGNDDGGKEKRREYLRAMLIAMADEASIRGRDAVLDPGTFYPFTQRILHAENPRRWRAHNLMAKRLAIQLVRKRLNTIARFWLAVRRDGLRSSDLARAYLEGHGIDIRRIGGLPLEAIRSQWFEDPTAVGAVDRMTRRLIGMVGSSADRPAWPPFDKLDVAMAPQTILMAYVYGFRPTAVFDMLGPDETAIAQAAAQFAANMDRCVKTLLLESGAFAAVARADVQTLMRDLYAYMLRLQVWERKLQTMVYPMVPPSSLFLDQPALLQPMTCDEGELIRVDRLVYALLSPSRFDGLTFADVFPGAFYRSVTRPRLEEALGIVGSARSQRSPLGRDAEGHRLAAFRAAAQFVRGDRARSEAFLRHVCHYQIVRGSAGSIRGTLEWARFILVHVKDHQRAVTVRSLLMGGLITLVVKRCGELDRIEILRWSAQRIRRLQRLVDALVDHRVGARLAALLPPSEAPDRFWGTEFHCQAMYAARASISEQIAVAADAITDGALDEGAASRHAIPTIAWDLLEIARLSDAIYGPIIRHAMEVYRLEASMMLPPQ